MAMRQMTTHLETKVKSVYHIILLNGFQMYLKCEPAAAAKSLQSCSTLCDPIDGSPPGSPFLGFSSQEPKRRQISRGHHVDVHICKYLYLISQVLDWLWFFTAGQKCKESWKQISQTDGEWLKFCPWMYSM